MADVLLEYDTIDAVVAAARALEGTATDAYVPHEIPELEEALAPRRTRIPYAVGIAAFVGFWGAVALIDYTAAFSYPIDVAGRPLQSFLADGPIAFESAILAGTLTAVVLLFAKSGMPRLWDPESEIEGLGRATVDRYFLRAPAAAVEARGDFGALRVVRLGEGAS